MYTYGLGQMVGFPCFKAFQFDNNASEVSCALAPHNMMVQTLVQRTNKHPNQGSLSSSEGLHSPGKAASAEPATHGAASYGDVVGDKQSVAIVHLILPVQSFNA